MKKIIILLVLIGLIIFFYPKGAGDEGGEGGPWIGTDYSCLGIKTKKMNSDATLKTCYGIPYNKTCSVDGKQVECEG
jgi:hypothetical protein